MRHLWTIVLLAWLLATPALADPAARWARLPESARATITVRREVRGLQRERQLRTAHPEVAKRLSDDLSRALGRSVTVPARRIVQVVWGSPEHQALRKALSSTVGIGVYPSKTWGHSKLRLGDLVTDAVPAGAAPFPSTGTRARLVPADGMHGRYYEAVFASDPAAIEDALARARGLVAEKCSVGMGCASFVSKIVREHLQAADARSPGAQPYAGKLDAFRRSESAAGPLWKKAAGADPALIVVYTPPGDYRTITHPGFKFDYALR